MTSQGAALFLDRILPSMVLKLWHKFRVISLLGSSATCIFFCCVVCQLSLHTTTAIIIHFAVNAVLVSLLSSPSFSADISLQSSAIRLSTTKHTASNVQPFTVLMCLRPSHMRVSSWCIVLWLRCRRIFRPYMNSRICKPLTLVFVHVYHGRVWM